jgi:cell division protein FtsA
MKRTKIGAIDVGTTKVCTIMGDVDDDGSLRVLGVGIAPSRGLQKALVVNVNEAKAAIRESVKKAEQTAGYKLESAYVGVTGRHVRSINNKGAIAVTRNDRLVRPDDLKRVLQVARSVKIPSDHELLHVIPRNYAVDGQEGVKNPVGMHGVRLDVETHIITAAVTSIQNLTKCIRGVGIDIDDLVLEPLASAEAVLTPEERQAGVIIADIGGYQVTRDIHVGLGISFEIAEEMKKKYGNVLPSEEEGDTNISVSEDAHNISYRDLNTIIRTRVEELLRLVVLELPQTDYLKLAPAGLVLTGGCSNLPGIAELAEQVTRMPVRVGSPVNLFGVGDVLNNPAYATSVGLLLWKMKNSNPGTQSWTSKPSGWRSVFARLVKLFG